MLLKEGHFGRIFKALRTPKFALGHYTHIYGVLRKTPQNREEVALPRVNLTKRREFAMARADSLASATV
jgi:hypothetical protein